MRIRDGKKSDPGQTYRIRNTAVFKLRAVKSAG